jgi:type IV pilus assembly protein PilM
MFFKSKKVIGLDIGTSSIKVAEIEVSGKRSSLISFGITPTPNGTVTGGEITDITAVSNAIRGLALEIKSKRRMVSTGMWGTAVIVKKITIPKIEPSLVADQIQWEAEQYIPFDINEISLAHHILKKSGSPETMDILLVAAQNQLVVQYAEAVESAGLSCEIIDVSGFALANCFECNYGKRIGECIGILNLGAGISNFVVVSDGEVVFNRDIPTGGLTYTNDIHKELGVTLGEAETLKISASAGREVPEEVHRVIQTTTESVTEEIHNSFEFFGATASGLAIEKCYYSGGCSSLPGLVENISKTLNLSFERVDPFLRVAPSARGLSPGYLQQIRPFAPVALGLAMRKAGDR